MIIVCKWWGNTTTIRLSWHPDHQEIFTVFFIFFSIWCFSSRFRVRGRYLRRRRRSSQGWSGWILRIGRSWSSQLLDLHRRILEIRGRRPEVSVFSFWGGRCWVLLLCQNWTKMMFFCCFIFWMAISSPVSWSRWCCTLQQYFSRWSTQQTKHFYWQKQSGWYF